MKRTGIAATTQAIAAGSSQQWHAAEKKKIIKGYYANIDPEKVGFTLTATIHLRITKGNIMDVQSSIANHPRVFAVYDIFLYVQSQ